VNLEPLQRFNRNYVGDYPFLQRLKEDWARRRPLAGLSVLHNLAITRETLLKLESLLLGGATVTVTHLRLPGLRPRQDCIAVLQEAGVAVEVDHARIAGRFDFALDCCAQISAMPGVQIVRGYVELTQSGTPAYRALKTGLPIYSVDESKLKRLEGMFGTGEACVRAIKELIEPDLAGKSFLLIGFGKVGRGIAKHLARAGARLIVCDRDAGARARAAGLGYATLAGDDRAALRDTVNGAFAVVAATGVEGLVQRLIRPEEIDPAVHLINMGADDEYGEAFLATRIAGEKAPLNFLLEAPTAMYFIDPIFAAHNRCCLDILEAKAGGFLPLPADMDLPWVEEWSRRYAIDVGDIHD
jgi:adenosylhomocysteinase